MSLLRCLDQGLRRFSTSRKPGTLRRVGSSPVDTSTEAAAIQLATWRAMMPAERALVAFELCEATTAAAVAGIRLRHPHITDTELAYELCRRRYGQPLTDEAFGRSQAE